MKDHGHSPRPQATGGPAHAHSGPGHHHHGGFAGGHDHSHDLRAASRKSLVIALALILSYMVAEVVGGILSGSLALLADAGHMLADAAAIGIALGATYLSGKAHTPRQTYGYHRLEILAALLNVLAVWLVAFGVIREAIHRFSEPPAVDGLAVLAVGVVGLVVNLAAAWILRRPARYSVNVEGAFAHVIADLLGSVGVVVSGILVWAFGWALADPVLSMVIGGLILASTWRLLAKVIHVLLEGVPDHVDIHEVGRRMEALEGVSLVHDLHVWTLSPGNDALTAHVVVDDHHANAFDPLLRRLQEIASHEFGIRHITIQMERSPDRCTENHHFSRARAAPGGRPGSEQGNPTGGRARSEKGGDPFIRRTASAARG